MVFQLTKICCFTGTIITRIVQMNQRMSAGCIATCNIKRPRVLNLISCSITTQAILSSCCLCNCSFRSFIWKLQSEIFVLCTWNFCKKVWCSLNGPRQFLRNCQKWQDQSWEFATRDCNLAGLQTRLDLVIFGGLGLVRVWYVIISDNSRPSVPEFRFEEFQSLC